MKKILGFVIPSAIIITGIGSIIANVFLIAHGNFRYFFDYSILNVNSEISLKMLTEHGEVTLLASHAIFLLFILPLMLSAFILIMHKKLTVIQLRVLAIVAGFLFTLRPTVWATTVSMIFQNGYFETTQIQQDAYLHFMVGNHFENYKFILSYFTAGLMMFGLLAAQVVWTFHIEDSPETIARRKSLEQERAATRTAATISQPIQKASPARNISVPNTSSPKQLSEELSALTNLHESGALTDEEFTAAKNRILGLK